MAKRNRHATALFEVMSPGKLPPPIASRRKLFQSPPFFKSLKWPARQMTRREEAVATIEQDPSDDDRDDPTMAPAVLERRESAVIEHKPMVIEPETAPDIADVTFEPEPTYAEPPMKLNFDWTNTAIAVSGVVILVGLAILVERHFVRGHAPLMVASSTAAVHSPAAYPDVMNLAQRSGKSSAAPPPQQSQPARDAGDPITMPTDDATRTLNRNYVVMQRYDTRQSAQDAADFLTKAGVSCTVVKGLARISVNLDWFYVVGEKDFGPHCRGTPDFEAYLEQIRKASVQFAGKTKWKQFTPSLYRWDAAAQKATSD